MKCYHKLVRDQIPTIIEASGQHCVTMTLTDDDDYYIKMVDEKLDEELEEYHKDQTIEELADLLEVIYAAAAARGYTAEQLDVAREVKAQMRGRFEKRILMLGVIEKEE